ncbi:hypothetical protein ACSMXN_13380 [Jatrophihabitans sp. DSM 45814]
MRDERCPGNVREAGVRRFWGALLVVFDPVVSALLVVLVVFVAGCVTSVSVR